MMKSIRKYPRTCHIEGSGVQRGEEDVEVVPFSRLADLPLVVEEKLDGANSGISLSGEGELLLQSRGHYLVGGPRERQFELLKAWATRRSRELRELLGERYLLYGEWLYAKHTVFYTDLPHYFMEFDIYDTVEGQFLDTDRRRILLRDAPFIVSVPVLHTGHVKTSKHLLALVGKSTYIRGDHLTVLRSICAKQGKAVDVPLAQTDPSDLMEGLYVKWEENGEVRGRFKYVRSGFLQTVFDSESHWMNRPIIPNQLREGVDLFA